MTFSVMMIMMVTIIMVIMIILGVEWTGKPNQSDQISVQALQIQHSPKAEGSAYNLNCAKLFFTQIMQTNIDIDIADNFDKMLIMNGNLWNADISADRWKLARRAKVGNECGDAGIIIKCQSIGSCLKIERCLCLKL